jgi:hypothetical protein
MSYIGNQVTTTAFLTDQFSGNGSTVAFTMSAAPATTSSIIVAVTGVLQDPSTYAVSGTTLTFSAAPPTGTGNISVRYLGIPASGVTTTAYRTVTEFTATSGQTTFNVPSYTVGYINVYRNGVRLGAADFTATTGTTVVLASAAILGDLVTTESFYVSSVLNAIPATAGAVNSTYIANGAVGSTQIAAGGVAQSNVGTGVAGTGPAFSANTVTAQTITTNTFTKIAYNVEVFDTANCYDNATNYRFTPNVAGYYQINGNASLGGGTVGYVQCAIYKNGSPVCSGSAVPNNNNVGGMVTASSVIYLNGSTDYVEFYLWQNQGSSVNLQTSAGFNTFSGSLVRAA